MASISDSVGNAKMFFIEKKMHLLWSLQLHTEDEKNSANLVNNLAYSKGVAIRNASTWVAGIINVLITCLLKRIWLIFNETSFMKESFWSELSKPGLEQCTYSGLFPFWWSFAPIVSLDLTCSDSDRVLYVVVLSWSTKSQQRNLEKDSLSWNTVISVLQTTLVIMLIKHCVANYLYNLLLLNN